MRALIAGLLLALPFSAASASSFDVAPTTVDIAGGRSGVLYLTNRGEAPITVQIEPFDWSQPAGDDALAPSSALEVSPPIVTLAPNRPQTVRLLAPLRVSAECAYRLVVSELPDAAPRTGGTLRMLLQFRVPVFVNVSHRPQAALAWSARRDHGSLAIAVQNTGAAHAKLSALAVDAKAIRIAFGAGIDYVLAGATRRWHIENPRLAGASVLSISGHDETIGSDIASTVPVQP